MTAETPRADPHSYARQLQRQRIGDLLVEEGLVSSEALRATLAVQRMPGERRRIGELLIELGHTNADAVAAALAKNLGLKLADFETDPPKTRAARHLTQNTSKQLRLIVCEMGDGHATIAMADPTNVVVIDDVMAHLRCSTVTVIVTTQQKINEQIARIWAGSSTPIAPPPEHHHTKGENQHTTLSRAAQALISGDDTNQADTPYQPQRFVSQQTEPATIPTQTKHHNASDSFTGTSNINTEPSSTALAESALATPPTRRRPLTEIIPELLETSFMVRASDLIIDISAGSARYQIMSQGVHYDPVEIPTDNPEQQIDEVLKHLGLTMNGTTYRGSAVFNVGDVLLDVRVSIVRAAHGLAVAFRTLSRGTGVRPLDSLGMSAEQLSLVSSTLASNEGLLLITGARATGISTTAYSVLHHSLQHKKRVVTLERGPEMLLDGALQIDLSQHAGPWDEALLTALSLQPDVLFVADTVDARRVGQLARITRQGPLVVATMNSASVVNAVEEWVAPWARSTDAWLPLIVAMNQYLVPIVCSGCAESVAASEHDRVRLSVPTTEPLTVVAGQGCARCRNSGYFDRVGIFQTLSLDGALQPGVRGAAPVRPLALKAGLQPLQAAAIELVKKGMTSPEQIDAVPHFL